MQDVKELKINFEEQAEKLFSETQKDLEERVLRYLSKNIFKEEVKKFGLEDKTIKFRFGYPKGLHASYTDEYEDGTYFITIDHRVKNLKEFKRHMRHQLYHIKRSKYGFLNEIFAYLAEYFPLEKLERVPVLKKLYK